MNGISIKTNVAALRAERRLAESSTQLSRAYERLSSGMRINHASDDPAGLAISSTLRADSRVFSQALRNVNDGLSLLNVAEGALGALSGITMRQRELATQASNGTYTLAQRRALNAEANALVDEFNRIVATTKFNGRALFEQSNGELRIQAGYGVTGGIGVSLGDELSRTVGTVTFGSARALQSSNEVYGYTLGDLDGDGDADLVSMSTAPTTTALVRLGNGDGTFTSGSAYQGGGVGGYGPVLSDFNADGRLDLAFTNAGGSGSLAVMLGNGNGTFGSCRTYATGTQARDIQIGDFNEDGRSDMAVAMMDADKIGIFLGQGDGSFTLGKSFTVPEVAATAVGDYNSDGILDLVVANSRAYATLMVGRGDGSFRTTATMTIGPGFAFAVDSGDINNDGNLDFVVSNGHDILTGYRTCTFLGNGNGTFRMSSSYSLQNIGSVSLADLDNDGRLDLLAGGFVTNASIFALRGNGDGTFRQTDQTTGDATVTKFITAADVNNDGVLDQLYNDPANDRIMLRLANTTTTAVSPYLNLNTAEDARSAMSVLDGTLNRINMERGLIGSSQSRLGAALNNIAAMTENFRAAEGRIMDADVAEETAALVRTQILQQAGAAVLAQANAQPALALKLLGG